MKCKLLTLTLSLLLIQPALAVSPEPETCPSIAAIKAVGVDDAGSSILGWVAFTSTPSYYDTKEEWGFGLLVPASNKEEALEKAKTSIATLTLLTGPYQDRGKWGCAYTNQQQAMAFAITPFTRGMNTVNR